MIPNLQPNTTYAIHLRSPSASGGKDWVGSVTSQGELHTYWGKTGNIYQHAVKPGDMTVLLRITNNKRRCNYSMVDEYTDQQGWQSQLNRASVRPGIYAQNFSPVPAIDWVEAPNTAIKYDF